MNKIATVIIGIGVIVTLVGIFLLLGIEERAVEKIEEGVLYEGADGDMEITGVSDKDDIWFVVHIESTYEGGGEGQRCTEKGEERSLTLPDQQHNKTHIRNSIRTNITKHIKTQ